MRYWVLLTVILLSGILKAQLVGNDVYLKGNYLELGINGTGGFEGVNTTFSPVPSGYILRGTSYYYGIYANPQLNGWLSYDGDFLGTGFTIENGWGIEIVPGTGPNIQTYNTVALGINMPGTITYSTSPGYLYATGTYTTSGLSDYDISFTIKYVLGVDDLFYKTIVTVTNNNATVIPEMYYFRNIAPDNNEVIGAGAATVNTVLSQPFGTSTRAQVVAKQSIPSTSAVSLIGEHPNFRCSIGGNYNSIASNIWNGTGVCNGTVGATSTTDEDISLAYKITGLAPGASETFEYYTLFADSLLNSNLNDYIIQYSGAGTVIKSETKDTAYACGELDMTLTGYGLNNYDWTWFPSMYLNLDTGVSVHCTATDTITYTIVGDHSGTLPNDTLYVTVIPATAPDLIITSPGPLCNSYDLSTLVYVDNSGILTTEVGVYTAIPQNGFDNGNLFGGPMVYPEDTLYLMLTDTLTGCYDVEPLNLVWNDILFDIDYTTTACTTGTATAELINLSAPSGFTVLWSTGQTTNLISGINMGPLSVQLTGPGGCITNDTVTIVQNLFTFDLLPTPEGCGNQNGSIQVINLSDSLGIYSYNWSNGQTTTTIDSLTAGFYSLTMTNQDGCQYTDTVTVPFLVTTFGLDVGIINSSCFSCPDGSVYTFLIGSPLLPATYSWSNGATTPNILNVIPGAYIVTVIDAAGCIFVDTFVVGYPAQVTEIGHLSSFNVYPVPAHNYIFIGIEGEISKLTIYGIDGKKVVSVAGHNQIEAFDISGLARGIYNMNIWVGHTVYRKQFVKN